MPPVQRRRVKTRSPISTGSLEGATTNQLLLRQSDGEWRPGQAATASIANDAVTYAKMQNIAATQRVLGRNSAGAGDTEEVTAAQILDWLGATQGQILYRNATVWTVLAPGTSGQVLQTGGAGANPSWVTSSGLAANSADVMVEAMLYG